MGHLLTFICPCPPNIFSNCLGEKKKENFVEKRKKKKKRKGCHSSGQGIERRSECHVERREVIYVECDGERSCQVEGNMRALA
jgi:hypothetical protein